MFVFDVLGEREEVNLQINYIDQLSNLVFTLSIAFTTLKCQNYTPKIIFFIIAVLFLDFQTE